MICYMSHLFFWLFVLRKVVFFIYIQHQIINKSESYYKWVQLVLAQLNISVNIEYCRLYRFGTYITECNHVCLALPTQINIYGMVQVLLCYTILGIYKRKKGNKKVTEARYIQGERERAIICTNLPVHIDVLLFFVFQLFNQCIVITI